MEMYYKRVGESQTSYTRMVFQNEMLHGQSEEYLSDLIRREGESGMNFRTSSFYLCLTGLPKRVYTGRYGQSANDNMVLYIQWEKEMRSFLEQHGCIGEIILYLYDDKQNVLLFSPDGHTKEERRRTALQVARRACQYLGRMYRDSYLKDGAYANIALLSEELHGWSEIGPTMQRMIKGWDKCFFRMAESVWEQAQWGGPHPRPSQAELSESIYQLKNGVLSGNPEQVQEQMNRLFCQDIKPSFDRYLLQDVLSELKQFSRECRSVQHEIELRDEELDTLFDAGQYPNLELMTQRLSELFLSMAELAGTGTRYYSPLIQKTIRILQENYPLPELSLDYVAERVNVTSAYLSNVFKKEVGVNMVQYITKLRMERAQNLLKTTGMKISEIAEATGYYNKRYFSTVFRRITGTSPQTYREKSSDSPKG